MNNNIEPLLNVLREIHFDSIILIFGFGEYLDIISENIVKQNKVYIFDLDNSSKNIDKKNIDEKISIVSFDEEKVFEILSKDINPLNYLNIYLVEYSEYSRNYKDEYDRFIEILDEQFYKMRIYDNTLKGFREVELRNTLLNLKNLNKSSSIDEYMYINRGIPALIVSGGPSLDKNIFDLVRAKEKLDRFFIIAGNRTVISLMVNGIKPDLIVSVDPQDVTYEMLKDYLDLNIPLLYYETTNSKVLDNHKGTKIVTTRGIYERIEGIDNISQCYIGGSVAHTSTDAAVALGCNPIIFLGQDFAYTYNKEHAIYSTHKIDNDAYKYEQKLIDKDVRGNDINTSVLFKRYKQTMENYIDIYTKEGIVFYNCSYGADIKGAKHVELNNIMNDERYSNYKNKLTQLKLLNINLEKLKYKSIEHIECSVLKINGLLKRCKSVLNNEYEDDQNDVIVISDVLSFIVEFFNDKNNLIFSSYLEEFLVTVQSKYFNVEAKDYESKSIDMKYQADVFTKYLNDLKEVLDDTNNIIKEIL